MLYYADFLSLTSENLRLLRRLYGLTQENVADAILLSRSTYACAEQGKSSVGFYNAYLLSLLYNIPLEQILDEELKAKCFELLLSS